MIPLKQVNRRRILKGMLGGSAVTIGMPFLDCFLNSNGTRFREWRAVAGCLRYLVLGTRSQSRAVGAEDARKDHRVWAGT